MKEKDKINKALKQLNLKQMLRLGWWSIANKKKVRVFETRVLQGMAAIFAYKEALNN